jgi:hypothetical protein
MGQEKSPRSQVVKRVHYPVTLDCPLKEISARKITGSNPVRVDGSRKCFIPSYLCRLIWMGYVDFADIIAKTFTKIHCFKTSVRNWIVGAGDRRTNATTTPV